MEVVARGNNPPPQKKKVEERELSASKKSTVGELNTKVSDSSMPMPSMPEM
jgi:hypothetical protein